MRITSLHAEFSAIVFAEHLARLLIEARVQRKRISALRRLACSGRRRFRLCGVFISHKSLTVDRLSMPDPLDCGAQIALLQQTFRLERRLDLRPRRDPCYILL